MKFSLATPILLTLLVAASSPESSARPNVILIMVDDLDAGSLRSAVDAGYMPNLLGTVIREGTTFTDSFVTLSLCCPSRATSLTGQYSHNHGVIRNSGEFGGFERFDDRSTLATWLQDAGYHTGHVGKYLNGYSDPSYVPPGWDRWQALVDPSAYCMYGYTISDNGNSITYGTSPAEYQTDVLAARSEGFVQDWHERGDRRPFYLSIAPLAPHVETCRLHRSDIRPAPRHTGSVSLRLPTPPSYNELDMSDKPVWMRSRPLLDRATLQALYRNRIASLRAVDDLIGRLVARLGGVGALDETAILFTSDNGFLLGLHRWRGKELLYEESIRVPLIVRLPEEGEPARSEALVLNNDLAPTIAALAEVTPGLAVDGRSLLPLLQRTPTRWRERFLVEYPPTGEQLVNRPFFAVREERLIYAETQNFPGTETTYVELYDLSKDPFQLRSLHGDRSLLRVAQKVVLKKRLELLKDCGGGSCQVLEN